MNQGVNTFNNFPNIFRVSLEPTAGRGAAIRTEPRCTTIQLVALHCNSTVLPESRSDVVLVPLEGGSAVAAR